MLGGYGADPAELQSAQMIHIATAVHISWPFLRLSLVELASRICRLLDRPFCISWEGKNIISSKSGVISPIKAKFSFGSEASGIQTSDPAKIACCCAA